MRDPVFMVMLCMVMSLFSCSSDSPRKDENLSPKDRYQLVFELGNSDSDSRKTLTVIQYFEQTRHLALAPSLAENFAPAFEPMDRLIPRMKNGVVDESFWLPLIAESLRGEISKEKTVQSCLSDYVLKLAEESVPPADSGSHCESLAWKHRQNLNLADRRTLFALLSRSQIYRDRLENIVLFERNKIVRSFQRVVSL